MMRARTLLFAWPLFGYALIATAHAQQLMAPVDLTGVVGNPMPVISRPSTNPTVAVPSMPAAPVLPSVPLGPTPIAVPTSVGAGVHLARGTLDALARSLPEPPIAPLPGLPSGRDGQAEAGEPSDEMGEHTVTLRRTECRLVAVDPPNLDFDGVPALGNAVEHERIFNVSVYCPDDRAVRLVTRVSVSGTRHPSHIPVKIRAADASESEQPADVVFFRDGIPVGEQTLQTGGQEMVVPISARLVDPASPDAIPRTVGTIEVDARQPGLYLVEEGTRVPRVTMLEASGIEAQSPWISIADPAQ